jgi:hypothetical protein
LQSSQDLQHFPNEWLAFVELDQREFYFHGVHLSEAFARTGKDLLLEALHVNLQVSALATNVQFMKHCIQTANSDWFRPDD